jgi:nitrite reductase/ring-hydroxylating ferredoxin subunit
MLEHEKFQLCLLEDLVETGSRGAMVTTAQGPVEILLVHKGNKVYGYVNRCPHTGVNLDWLPDQFLDLTGSFIQCATHGALFRIEDGVCLRGPCVGDQLQPIELHVAQGVVFFRYSRINILPKN